MIRGSHFPAGLTWSTVRADCDFETYSEAGHAWNPNTNKWEGPPGAPKGKKGLEVVGAANYASHESTEVLSFWYDLKDGSGRHFWRPGLPNPTPLLDYVKAGGVIEAWNVAFEWWIWNEVCAKKYGWPPLPIEQTYDAMAKARAHSLPGGLKKAAQVVQSAEQKDERGTDLLKYFSVPRNPTKTDLRRRIAPIWDEEQAAQWREYLVACGVKPTQADKLILETRAKTVELSQYNEQDIIAEAAVSKVVPDLSSPEYRNWILDQRINRRGIGIDLDLVHGAISVINSASGDLGRQMWEICGCRPTEVAQILAWLHGKGVHLDSLDEDALNAALGTDLPEDCRTVLEIRGLLSSASVKKVFALNNTARAGRVHDLYVFHGAHTGRPTGSGAQPTNLPKAGPAVWQCEECGHHHWVEHGSACPYCSAPFDRTSKRREWSPEAADDAIRIAKTGSFELMRWFFSDALFALAGCLRGVFEAKPGHTFVSSDFSAIEGVVIAALANEEWRLEVFHGHGMIYELSAAKILGITLEEMLDYKKKNGQHHPARGKIGKVAELASGFGGWINSWKAFGATQSDEEIKEALLAWRAASPAIVYLWGGQRITADLAAERAKRRGAASPTASWTDRELRWGVDELFGLEGRAIEALRNPGYEKHVERLDGAPTGISYLYYEGVLYCRTPGGGTITYHNPTLEPSEQSWRGMSISYWGWNTNPKNGPPGWIKKGLYGGRMAENVVQKVARDIQMHAIDNLERAGFPVVMHTYDEDVCEVPVGATTVEEVEALMMDLPDWAKGWPIKAKGGWCDTRYRKG